MSDDDLHRLTLAQAAARLRLPRLRAWLWWRSGRFASPADTGIRTQDGTLYPAPRDHYWGLSWGYGGSGPGSLALLIYRLLDDITAPGADHAAGAPDGLDELTELSWPTGTVLPREVLEAARDGKPYQKPVK